MRLELLVRGYEYANRVVSIVITDAELEGLKSDIEEKAYISFEL